MCEACLHNVLFPHVVQLKLSFILETVVSADHMFDVQWRVDVVESVKSFLFTQTQVSESCVVFVYRYKYSEVYNAEFIYVIFFKFLLLWGAETN